MSAIKDSYMRGCVACLLILLFPGCQDPAFRTRQTRRDQRMAHLIESGPILDGYRLDSMRRMLDGAEQRSARRPDNLDDALRLPGHIESLRTERLRRSPVQTDPWFKFISTGHPELIGPTFADMVY